jgi:electron transport complex protein RnfE
VFLSLADGLGIGLGFTLALALLGAIREFFGAGTLKLVFGEQVFIDQPFAFLQQAPGAFVALGLLLGIMNVIGRMTARGG